MALFAIVNYFAITKWHLLLQLVMEVIMDSPKLAALFHVNENEWNTVYKMLFDSPLTHHLDIEIKQYKSSIGFPVKYHCLILRHFLIRTAQFFLFSLRFPISSNLVSKPTVFETKGSLIHRLMSNFPTF